jgi:O-antigen ligase
LAGLVATGILIALPHLIRRRWSLRSSAVAIATGVVSLLLFATFAGRAARRLDLAGIDASRLCTFEAMGNAIADSPVSGTGFGTFAEIFPAYRLAECAGINGVWYQAHNSYLEGYFGLGAVFGVVVAFGLVSLLWIFAIGLRQRRGFRFAPAAATGVLVAISLHALVDFSIQIHGIAVYAAAVLGTGVAISLNRRRPQQSGPAYPGARERDAEIESRRAPDGSDMTENTDRDRRDARQRGAGASPETA